MILTCFEVHGMADDRTVVVNPHDLGRQGVMQHMSTTWKDGRAHHVMRFNDGHQIVVESISGPRARPRARFWCRAAQARGQTTNALRWAIKQR